MGLERGQRRGERLSRTSCTCLVVGLDSDSAAQSIGWEGCLHAQPSEEATCVTSPWLQSVSASHLHRWMNVCLRWLNLEIKFCNEATALSLGVLGISGKATGGTPRIGWTQMHMSHGVNWHSVNTKDLHHQEAPRSTWTGASEATRCSDLAGSSFSSSI